VKLIKPLVAFGFIGLAINFGWHLHTDPPSTRSVCYTWSKATDPLSDPNGIDGADWLATHLKTEKDLRAINKEVLSAMRLYDTGVVVADSDPYGRHGLRQFVLDACEKASPGSTKH
jgi:hypothetical protein